MPTFHPTANSPARSGRVIDGVRAVLGELQQASFVAGRAGLVVGSSVAALSSGGVMLARQVGDWVVSTVRDRHHDRTAHAGPSTLPSLGQVGHRVDQRTSGTTTDAPHPSRPRHGV